MARWRSCNVLQAEKEVRHLWQFSAGGDKFTLQREETKLPNESLPARVVAKDWQDLFQPKLNVAWLPSHQVFLRVVPLPKSELAETQSMIELQMEKLSPLPVAQVVWTFELVPTAETDLQTAIVVVVARHHVEEFLGQIEGQGYLADRLELPLLDQIRATRITTDGLWIYPGVGPDQYSCLVAWWYGGTLRNLSLIHLPPTEQRGKLLQEQLAQMAWAGELEGWLTSPPAYHLVADAETAAAWTPFFTAEQGVIVVSPLPAPELAALTARRAAAANGVITGLLPPEYLARYRQQFIDHLWMRGVGAVLVVYVFGVIIYLGLTEVAKWRLRRVQDQVTALAPSYTNSLQLKEQVRVLQEQLDLQFAALDCYKAIAEFLPAELTLKSLTFESGSKLRLTGNAANEDRSKVDEFNKLLRSAAVKNRPLFAKVEAAQTRLQNNQINWNFTCDLKLTGP